jgi:hypothetical protein
VTISLPVPESDVSPKAPLIILAVAELAAPAAPVRVGAVENISVETLAAGVAPKFVPRKRTEAPAVRDKEVKVIVVDPPDPGVIVTVLCPEASVRAPVDSAVLALELPIRLKDPPFIVNAAVSLRRFRAEAVELSTVRVALLPIVIAELGIAPEFLRTISPLFKFVAPVKLLKPSKVKTPSFCLVRVADVP